MVMGRQIAKLMGLLMRMGYRLLIMKSLATWKSLAKLKKRDLQMGL